MKLKFTKYCTCAIKNPGPSPEHSRDKTGFSSISTLEPYMLKAYLGKNKRVPKNHRYWSHQFLEISNVESISLSNHAIKFVQFQSNERNPQSPTHPPHLRNPPISPPPTPPPTPHPSTQMLLEASIAIQTKMERVVFCVIFINCFRS